MHKTLVAPVLLLLALPALTGCNKVQARVELKQGNAEYQNESYKSALQQYKKGLKLDPDATFAWRSAGLSALALYRPGDPDPENMQYANEAIGAFEKYLADYPDDTKIRDFLMGMYVDAKQYDKALAYADQQIQANPESAGEMENFKIRVLLQSGRYEQAWQAAQQHRGANQAQILQSVAAGTWDKAYRDPSLSFDTRVKMVDIGLQAVDQAVKVKPDYFEAMVYYGLLLREKAKVETDAVKRAELMTQAVQWSAKAQELRKAQALKEKQEQKKVDAAEGAAGTS
jgi:tetratricopeptide (TPR) repeat protein